MSNIKNPFKYAQGERVKIVGSQKKEIRELYVDTYNDVLKELNRIKRNKSESSSVKRNLLNGVKKEIVEQIKIIDGKTENIIENNMGLMSLAVMKNNLNFMESLGFNDLRINNSFKISMVNRIISGNLYDGKWTLSSSIWGDDKNKINEINRIISQGLIKNKSIDEIATSLQKYLNPYSRKGRKWMDKNDMSRKKIDYRAQRLAKTMISHTYEETFVELTKNNPFIEAYKWITSGSDRVCEVCIGRESDDNYGLGPGIYPKDKLPLDHPNGMCTFDIVITMSDSEISDAIADWYFGVGDKSMNKKIDYFIDNIY